MARVRLTDKEWEAVLKALGRGEDEIAADLDDGYVRADPPLIKAIKRGTSKLYQARQDKLI